MAGLMEASAILAGGPAGGRKTPKTHGPLSPGMGNRTQSGRLIESAKQRITRKPRLEDEIRITVHIAETLSRQKYLLKLCRALMSYGARTHRLEEYMKMSARVLEIDDQFLYIPGCMIISFDDVSTHTTEVKLVRSAQGVDLGKLKDIHEIYKEVVHDVIGVEEATQRLDAIISNKPKHNPWLLVFVYGLASASVGPFGKSYSTAFVNSAKADKTVAFQARLIDIPIAFFLGSLLGFMNSLLHRSPISTAMSSKYLQPSSPPSSPAHLGPFVVVTSSASLPWHNLPLLLFFLDMWFFVYLLSSNPAPWSLDLFEWSTPSFTRYSSVSVSPSGQLSTD